MPFPQDDIFKRNGWKPPLLWLGILFGCLFVGLEVSELIAG